MSATRDVHFVSPLDLLLYLSSVAAIGGMTRADIADLAANSEERFVPAGTTFLEGDQPVQKVYMLVEGQVEVDTGTYREILEPPTGINWLRFHGRFDTNHQARAVVDSLLLEIDASRLRGQIERNSEMLAKILRQYAREILRLRDDLPRHPDDATVADPGTMPEEKLGLIQRLNQIAGPGGYWENANLDAVVTVVREMEEVRFKKGDVLWDLGHRSPYSWNLVSGTVECTNEAGQSVEVGAGFVLGVYDALADTPRRFGAVATHDGVALRSSLNEMLAVLEHHSDMALDLLAGVSQDFSKAYDAEKLRQQAIVATPVADAHV